MGGMGGGGGAAGQVGGQGGSSGAADGGRESGAAGAKIDAGAAGAGGSGSQPVPTMTCGGKVPPKNQFPLGCSFAWGIDSPQSGDFSSYGYVQLMSTWVGGEVKADGSITSCGACSWLGKLASTKIVPAFYAYFIGFLAHANGIVDGNQTGTKKLTTDGAALIKANRAKIVSMYAWYATEVYKVWPTKPLIWLLEGDYVQFQDKGNRAPSR